MILKQSRWAAPGKITLTLLYQQNCYLTSTSWCWLVATLQTGLVRISILLLVFVYSSFLVYQQNLMDFYRQQTWHGQFLLYKTKVLNGLICLWTKILRTRFLNFSFIYILIKSSYSQNLREVVHQYFHLFIFFVFVSVITFV